MPTIYVFQSEPAIDAVAVDDVFLAYDTSTGRTKTATGAQMQARVIDTASTAASMPATGITVIGSSAVKSYTLATPVAGYRKTIVNDLGSTATTINVSSAGVTFGSAKTTLTFTALDQAVQLEALSATRWEIVSNVGTVASS